MLALAGATLLASLGGLLVDALWEATLGVALLPVLFVATSVALLLVYVAGEDPERPGRSIWSASGGERWLVVVSIAIAAVASALLVTGLTRGRRGPHVAGCLIAVIAAIVQAVTVVALASD